MSRTPPLLVAVVAVVTMIHIFGMAVDADIQSGHVDTTVTTYAADIQSGHVDTTVTTYAAPDGAPVSSRFAAFADETPVPIYGTTSQARCEELADRPNRYGCDENRTQSWGSMWYSEQQQLFSLTITVVRIDGSSWGESSSPLVVRPRSAGIIPWRVNETTVAFNIATTTGRHRLSVESPAQMAADGVVVDSLMIFADPAGDTSSDADSYYDRTTDNVDTADTTSGVLLHFAAGFHDLGGQFVLPPNTSAASRLTAALGSAAASPPATRRPRRRPLP
jgi:hypothetical protein